MDGLIRHITACRNATLPGDRLALRLAGAPIGWVRAEMAEALATLGARRVEAAVVVPDAATLDAAVQELAARRAFRWRDEAFDVRAAPGGPVLAQVDRGVLPVLGILAEGVHLNGLVRRSDGWHLWVGRRSSARQLDPGKLDHLVAGGISAGFGPEETLAKEAAEEAGMPAAWIAGARKVGVITYAMERKEGLRRDRLHCYDLVLPEDFSPIPQDDEAEGFELWPLPRVLAAVRDSDDFKFNVNLVLIDLFLRQGLVPAVDAAGLRGALDRPE